MRVPDFPDVAAFGAITYSLLLQQEGCTCGMPHGLLGGRWKRPPLLPGLPRLWVHDLANRDRGSLDSFVLHYMGSSAAHQYLTTTPGRPPCGGFAFTLPSRSRPADIPGSRWIPTHWCGKSGVASPRRNANMGRSRYAYRRGSGSTSWRHACRNP